MIQRHTIILWSKAKNEPFKATVDKAYSLMQLLRNFGPELSPNYESINRKKDAKLFEWSYEAFEKLVKNGVNKEGKNTFAELGYSVSLFSSLNGKESAGISMNIGNTNPRFPNTFIMDLPQTYKMIDNESGAQRIESLFKECIEIFEPYWGCVANSVNSNSFDGFYKDDLPTTVHWLNYFGRDIVETVGENKIIEAPLSLSVKIGDGYLLKLDKFPINIEDNEIIRKQSEINSILGL